MITPLLLSEVVLPDYHPRAGAGCVVYGFVIHHADGPVLVDTGVGTGHAEVDSLFAAVHHPIDHALAEVGVQPTDITRLFPGRPLVVQRVEYEAALQPNYTISEWIEFPGARWTPVDGETEVLPGISVLPTPGHTIGHQSILVSQAERVDVIAGQASYDRDELDTGASAEPLDQTEAEQTSASARRIKATNPNRVFFSHDPRIWQPHNGEKNTSTPQLP